MLKKEPAGFFLWYADQRESGLGTWDFSVLSLSLSVTAQPENHTFHWPHDQSTVDKWVI